MSKHTTNSTPPKQNQDFYTQIAQTLSKKIDREVFERKCAPVKDILKIVGAGAFLAASFAIPNLPLVLKPFLLDKNEPYAWKRFDIPLLRRTLKRLENQKLVEISEDNGYEIVKITYQGQIKILKFALSEITIEKPAVWDKKWRLVSYDIPNNREGARHLLTKYLSNWNFYPFQESVFLHAYPCEKEIEFLREYLGIREYVRILIVQKIENDDQFREYFDI